MNQFDNPSSGGRRIYNVGAHGVANSSINQRILDGIDLNGSLGGQRYDQHFDSQISQDHSMENYSSRVHYGSGAPNDLSSSMRQLKRSETENVRTFGAGAVTFA